MTSRKSIQSADLLSNSPVSDSIIRLLLFDEFGIEGLKEQILSCFKNYSALDLVDSYEKYQQLLGENEYTFVVMHSLDSFLTHQAFRKYHPETPCIHIYDIELER